MRECYTDRIAPVVQARWENKREQNPGTLSKEPKAGFRAEVAREVFAALSPKECGEFADRAKADAAQAKTEYLAVLKQPAAKTPQERQRYADFPVPP
jgi:hypothetical protein